MMRQRLHLIAIVCLIVATSTASLIETGIRAE